MTYREFLPGMQNLNLIMRKHWTALNEEHSIKKKKKKREKMSMSLKKKNKKGKGIFKIKGR